MNLIQYLVSREKKTKQSIQQNERQRQQRQRQQPQHEQQSNPRLHQQLSHQSERPWQPRTLHSLQPFPDTRRLGLNFQPLECILGRSSRHGGFSTRHAITLQPQPQLHLRLIPPNHLDTSSLLNPQLQPLYSTRRRSQPADKYTLW